MASSIVITRLVTVVGSLSVLYSIGVHGLQSFSVRSVNFGATMISLVRKLSTTPLLISIQCIAETCPWGIFEKLQYAATRFWITTFSMDVCGMAEAGTAKTFAGGNASSARIFSACVFPAIERLRAVVVRNVDTGSFIIGV